MMLEFPRDRIADNGVDAEKTVDVLLRLAYSARMYRSPDGRLHAQVPVGDRLEMYGLKSAGFRDWLIDGYFSDYARWGIALGRGLSSPSETFLMV
jgi:hypothetical protein